MTQPADRPKRKRWVALFGVLALVSGCLGWVEFQKVVVSGWYRADRKPADPTAYKDRFERVALSDGVPCSELAARATDASSPIIVLVHGIGGDREEMEAALPVLIASGPASVFMFRWFPLDRRDVLAARFAAGLSHLAQCLPDSQGRILVIAHSAGGVVSAFAAGRIELPGPDATKAWITVLTVAAPLAGKMARPGHPDGSEQPALVLDMGTRIKSYPPAAPGVRVVHLRTHAPSDDVMVPDGDLSPNDPAIGVPGAPQIDLPEGLTHDGALKYVATEVAAGRWRQWRDGAPLTHP